MSNKIGRNEACPCGSGLKYKRCCGASGARPRPTAGSGELPPHVQATLDALQSAPHDDLAQLQATVDSAMARANAQALEDFAGLSSAQMHRILHFPFDSPELATWADPLPVPPAGVAIDLAVNLLEALRTEGAKRTAKGNLPRNLCRDLLAQHQAVHGEDRFFKPANLQSELDFRSLHRVRLALELGGLLRKYRGRFLPTQAATRRLARHGAAGIYPVLLQAYANRFNWAYEDGYPPAPILQQGVLFSLHLLQQFGDDWRPITFYEDAVLRAFPMLVDDFEDSSYWTAEQSFRNAFTLRMLYRFAAFFGLVEINPAGHVAPDTPRQLRALPLLEQVVKIDIGH